MDGRTNRRNKAPLSCRIRVDGRTNRRNKAAAVFNFPERYVVCPGRAYEFWSILYAIRLLMTTCVLRFTNWLTCQVNLRIRVCRENTLGEHGKETCSLSGL